ncbi:cellobiose-phosphorylase [Bifidobacterium pullorum]|uniref:Cellobiose-phosphorylase n=1 Tax=Bifidobacterium pullorum TaxID=78448 RepID=A0A7V8KQH8_9BIFI|nr:cellobiose-phosphorylase [Bifidobacterium pullorum]
MAIPTVAVLRTAGTTPDTGGGYSFYKDAKLRRITRYRYNNVPGDNGARNYYITRMNEDGTPAETWSPTFLPAKTPLDVYRCRHGIGYTVFEAERVGVASTLTAFVPLHTPAEVNRLDLTNNGDAPVTLEVTGSVEWCLWNALDDSSNFQRNFSTGEVEVERTDATTVIYHKTEFKERRNHYAFFGVNAPTVGFDTSRDEFLGRFNGWDTPQVIAEGRAHDSVAHGWAPIAALRFLLRVRHRPRHGIPRFEPGSARLRAPDPGARPRAHHRHRLHPAARRLRLAPVPAADQARQRGHRRRLQRRSAVAGRLRVRLPVRNRRRRHPERAGAVR